MPEYIYISDVGNSRIKKHLASDLSYVSKIGSQGSGDDQFSSTGPGQIAADGTYIYVTDPHNYRISKRLANLSFVSKIGSEGTGNDQFSFPIGMATDGSYLYVTDAQGSTYQNERINKRNLDLTYVDKIGSGGTGDDQFLFPHAAACDATHVYIADGIGTRIVKRLLNLTYVDKVSLNGEPFTIAVDSTYVYVAYADFISKFSTIIERRLKADLSYVDELNLGGFFTSPQGRMGISVLGSYLYLAKASAHIIEKRNISTFTLVDSFGSQGSGDNQFSYPEALFVVDESGPPPAPPENTSASIIW